MNIIARIKTDFPEKFGIPRQSGLAEVKGTIIFEPEYRIPEAVRGLEEFRYLWLIWEFEDVARPDGSWSPTVRPPRLGGNRRKGVFATRSPFRPNPIGLSSVKLDSIEYTPDGPYIHVSGADLRDGTPIYDIKPYLHYVDCHPDANDGFASEGKDHFLEITFPDEFLQKVPREKREALIQILRLDPRPSYQNDPNRTYGVRFADFNIRFRVSEDQLVVCGISKVEE